MFAKESGQCSVKKTQVARRQKRSRKREDVIRRARCIRKMAGRVATSVQPGQTRQERPGQRRQTADQGKSDGPCASFLRFRGSCPFLPSRFAPPLHNKSANGWGGRKERARKTPEHRDTPWRQRSAAGMLWAGANMAAQTDKKTRKEPPCRALSLQDTTS